MRVSYEWLTSLVDGPKSPEELEQELVRTGTEVEAVERTGAQFDHIYVGQVVSKEPHPDSDHMSVCMVDVGSAHLGEDGKPEPLQIVCGATNFKQNDKIVTALVGAEFGDFKIKKSKLRGVVSNGMNCSEKELGLSSESDGIMILPEDAPVGTPFAEYYKLSDTILDCEITPNRPDCLSMMGFATEVSAIYNSDTHMEIPLLEQVSDLKSADEVEVSIADSKLCSRYLAGVAHNVKVGPSPEWLVKRLAACGTRSINNIVDITNYVMFLTGQPLHAFDLNKLAQKGGKVSVVVRTASEGEKLTTLDSEARILTAEMTVIADGNAGGVIALAGVMGGKNSEVDDSTTDILLESACFTSGLVSRASRNLNLMSEASMRFERQVDPNGCDFALDIALALLEQCAGATVDDEPVDIYPEPLEPVTITMRAKRVCELVGANIATEDMLTYLDRLGCQVEEGQEDDVFEVTAPTNRPDLTREIDLVEEVLRLWGMAKVEPTLPAARNHAGGLSVAQHRKRVIGTTLRGLGLHETTTYCFADESDLEKLGMNADESGKSVEIINPLVSDQSIMRKSIIPGLLKSVAYNKAHGVENVTLYELGRVFFGKENKSQPQEPEYLAAVMSGKAQSDTWNQKYHELDFFDAKGCIEELLRELRIEKVSFRSADPEVYTWLQPGRAAEIVQKGQILGWVGNIHPLSLKAFEIDSDVVAFELNVAKLLERAQNELPYTDIPEVPGVEVDLALVVDEETPYEMVLQRLKSAGGKTLASVELFDVYRDKDRVGEGKKSLAFSLVYRDSVKTLTSEAVEKIHAKVVDKICKSCGGEVRA